MCSLSAWGALFQPGVLFLSLGCSALFSPIYLPVLTGGGVLRVTGERKRESSINGDTTPAGLNTPFIPREILQRTKGT